VPELVHDQQRRPGREQEHDDEGARIAAAHEIGKEGPERCEEQEGHGDALAAGGRQAGRRLQALAHGDEFGTVAGKDRAKRACSASMSAGRAWP
jgi:hypothetical protein